MGVLSEAIEKLLRNFISLKEDGWVQWKAQKNDWYDNCDKFNECYFIVKQMPEYPQHIKCQCTLKKIDKPIPNITAKATCDIRKFTEYVFHETKNKGKKALFESWGYTVDDSEYLQNLFTSQAIQKYCNGDYIYKGTNDYSVRIEIVIDISTKDGRTLRIKSGWSLRSKGQINLATPFSGYKK